MSQVQGLGPSTLRSDYLAATDKFIVLQSAAAVVQQQAALDVPGDQGLAYQVQFFQNRMKDQAGHVFERLESGYIDLVVKGSNFSALWTAAISNELQPISTAYAHQEIRTSADQVFSELGFQAGLMNQKASELADDLKEIDTTVAALAKQFDAALDAAVKSLSAETAADSAAIDKLTAAVTKNIQEIVTGATTAGSAVSGLLTGFLTIISDAKSDKPPAVGGAAKSDKSPAAGGDAKKDAGSKPPSTEFVVTAIKGASEGVAQTEQARADLNHNNDQLAAAYKNMANDNAILAVAKAVQAQNDLFAAAVHDSSDATAKLAATWGQPALASPGSGISQGFAEFVRGIDAVKSQQDADTLANELRLAGPAWESLNQQLASIRQALLQHSDN